MGILKKNVYVLSLFAIVISVYVLFAGRLKFEFPTNPSNYYSHQVNSFLHAKLSLFSTPFTHDLSIFNGKKYMYWGPSPTLLISPFIILFGVNFSDALYTAIICSFAPVILFLILQEIDRVGFIRTTNITRLILCIFFSFGTVFFLLSVNGGVWFTSQAINTLYILIALFLLFRFINKPSSRTCLILSSVFLGLAAWGRSSFLLYLPLFLFNIYLTVKHARQPGIQRRLVKTFLLFTIPLVIFLIAYFLFNYLRFGDMFETGYSFHNIHPHFLEDRQKHGAINLFYLPRNFYYMFLNFPKLVDKFPYFKFDQEGNSILFTSPLFIFLILCMRKYFRNYRNNLFQISVFLTSIAIVLSLLVFFGTGWVQFGYRYILDAIPLFIILLADTIKKVPIFVVTIFIMFSIIVNILGTLWFFTL